LHVVFKFMYNKCIIIGRKVLEGDKIEDPLV